MHRQYHTPWQLFFFLLAVIGVLMMSDAVGWSGGVRGWFEQRMLFLRPGQPGNDKEVREKLTVKVANLSYELEKMQDDNDTLRKQLESPLPPSFRFIPADVVQRQFDTDDKSLLIRVGKREGVREGMPVLVERALIGIVSKTTPHLATVRLLTSAESKVTVKTQMGVSGLLIGKKTGNMSSAGNALLDKILQSEIVISDETVVTSGDEFMPPNILIGTIVNVVAEPRDPFKQADVRLTADPDRITSVFVIDED